MTPLQRLTRLSKFLNDCTALPREGNVASAFPVQIRLFFNERDVPIFIDDKDREQFAADIGRALASSVRPVELLAGLQAGLAQSVAAEQFAQKQAEKEAAEAAEAKPAETQLELPFEPTEVEAERTEPTPEEVQDADGDSRSEPSKLRLVTDTDADSRATDYARAGADRLEGGL